MSNSNQNKWFAGLSMLSAQEVERLYHNGSRIDVEGYGVLAIEENMDREKLYRTVRRIHVRGMVKAPADIKAHYGI